MVISARQRGHPHLLYDTRIAQDSQISASEMTYIVSGGVLKSTH